MMCIIMQMWCWVYAVFLMTLSVFGRHQIFYVFVSHVFNIDGDCLKSKIFIQFSARQSPAGACFQCSAAACCCPSAADDQITRCPCIWSNAGLIVHCPPSDTATLHQCSPAVIRNISHKLEGEVWVRSAQWPPLLEITDDTVHLATPAVSPAQWELVIVWLERCLVC